jgi:hypothetical protein
MPRLGQLGLKIKLSAPLICLRSEINAAHYAQQPAAGSYINLEGFFEKWAKGVLIYVPIKILYHNK